MSVINKVHRFGFSAFAGMPPQQGWVAGYTALAAGSDYLIVLDEADETDLHQLFNIYLIDPNSDLAPPAGQGFYLQSPVNGQFVSALTDVIDGTNQHLFCANVTDSSNLSAAALFAYFETNGTIYFYWKNPATGLWHGLTNLATAAFGGIGVLATSSNGQKAPYLLAWDGIRQPIQWKIEPPDGWQVTAGANLNWVDFTLLGWTAFPFDFSNCSLDYANLSGLSLGYAVFANCDLSLTQLTPPLGASDSAWIDFNHATVNFASLGSDWRYLNLRAATINGLPTTPDPNLVPINASGCLLNEADLSNKALAQANFSGASLVNTDFYGAFLSKADFSGAILAPEQNQTLVSANFGAAFLYEANFRNAYAINVSFAGAFVYGDSAMFTGANLRAANFTGAYLAEADFSGIYERDLMGAVFDYACLANANFSGTQLGKITMDGTEVGFSFQSAALQGANFSGSSLAGANLANAAVSEDAGTLAITAVYYLGNLSFQPTSSVDYPQATQLAITDATTYCPSDKGPCSGAKLQPATPALCPSQTWPTPESSS